MFLAHPSVERDGVWVQVPGGRVHPGAPDDRVHPCVHA